MTQQRTPGPTGISGLDGILEQYNGHCPICNGPVGDAYVEACNQHDALVARVAELEQALRDCVGVVKVWHGEDVFDIYLAHSPEMKTTRDALARGRE